MIQCEKNLTHFYLRSLYLTTMKKLNSTVADVFTTMHFEKILLYLHRRRLNYMEEDACNITSFGEKS